MTLWRWEDDARLEFPRPLVINRRKFYSLAALKEWERNQAVKTACEAVAA